MIKRYCNRLQNLILKKISYIRTIQTTNKVVFLTFDDGPEKGITEFVLDELDKYNYKATFFCRGDNAESNEDLLRLIKEKGHSIGNHTYNHLHSYNTKTSEYVNDVKKADMILHSNLFRPPHGSMTLAVWYKLHKKYDIVYWSLNSSDSDMSSFDFENSIKKLKSTINPGEIVLFHFCHKHERETRLLLPVYLEWLMKQGFVSKAICSKQ